MDAIGSTTINVGEGVSGTAVGEPPPEEQAATDRPKSETMGQKKPARSILEIDIKKAHPESLESLTVVSNTYEQLPTTDGTQAVGCKSWR